MSVNAIHPAYAKFLPRWKIVRDVVEADASGHIRIIDINDKLRSDMYRNDAVLTNFTGRTKHALVGAVFRRKPVCEIPEGLDYVKEDVTGDNFTLDQLAQQTLGEVLMTGRYGILADFPVADDEDIDTRTQANVEEDDLKAYLYTYRAESIINWKTELVRGRTVLTLVVLEEITDELSEDGFTWVEKTQFRVLRLRDGIYQQDIFDEAGIWQFTRIPNKFDGTTSVFTEIPFTFIGSEDNNAEIDGSPLFGLATLNVAHLKNSADQEEYLHIAGSPTLVVSTSMSTEQWKSAVGGKLKIGSRNALNLGPNGNASFLQVNPTQVIDEAMKRKEDQAVMLGARLITPNSGVETAEAARIRHGSENSVLATIVANVGAGIKSALGFLAEFQGVESDDIEYELNTKFFDEKLDPQMMMAQIQAHDRGFLAKSDIMSNFRKGGILDSSRTDEDVEDDLSEEAPIDIELVTNPLLEDEEES